MRQDVRIALVLALGLLPALGGPARAQGGYDFAAEQEELSVPGETVQQADAAAQEAMKKSRMQVTVSTVGFDVANDQAAQTMLAGMAQAGNGGFFTADDAGQLSAALGAAALGQAGMAGGKDRVQITAPKDGEIVGPSVDISGKAPPGALVILYTMVYAADTGEEIRKVPGTRGRAKATGEFTFRIPMPRIAFGDKNFQLKYVVHAGLIKDDGSAGPETLLTLYSPKP